MNLHRQGYREEQFVLAGLRGDPPPEPAGLSVPRILGLCDWHGVGPLLARWASRAAMAEPPDLLRGLRDRLRRTAVDNLRLLARLPQLAGEMETLGMPFALLKGASLIPLVYQGAEERPLTDIDLLIRRRDWPRLREHLSRSGRYWLPSPERERIYTRYHQKVEVKLAADPACEFELHWNMEIEGRTAVPAEALLDRAVPVLLDGRSYPRLEDTDLALHLAIHAAHHATAPRLIWIHDLLRLARAGRISWDGLAARADAWDVRVAVGYALAYLEKIHPGVVPPRMAAIPVGPARRWILDRAGTPDPLLLTRSLEAPPWRWLASLLLLDSPGRAGRFVAGHIARKIRRVPSR